MSTVIRPEISPNNKYWIEKHRYYELKHFCMQYPMWKKLHSSLDGYDKCSHDILKIEQSDYHTDRVADNVEAKLYFYDRIRMVEKVAYETDPILGKYLLIGITEGISYDILKARLNIPCCKDTYYTLYRKFFWLLDKVRE